MKYAIIIPDGCADEPLDALGGRTPLQAARLAAVLPNPNRYNAGRPGPYVRRHSATIMARARSVRASGGAACVVGK